jgi:hypothetical protein
MISTAHLNSLHVEKPAERGGATARRALLRQRSEQKLWPIGPNNAALAERRLALFRRADLHRIAKFRLDNGEILPRSTWIYAFAAILDSATKGWIRIESANKTKLIFWPGLDSESVKDCLREHDITPSEAELDAVFAKIKARKAPIGGVELGRMLNLMQIERLDPEVMAKNIRPIDKDDAEVAEERKAKKAARKRARRRAAGAVPRSEYESNSISRQRPWEAEGISRSTWYRRRKAEFGETGMGAHPSPKENCEPSHACSTVADGSGVQIARAIRRDDTTDSVSNSDDCGLYRKDVLHGCARIGDRRGQPRAGEEGFEVRQRVRDDDCPHEGGRRHSLVDCSRVFGCRGRRAGLEGRRFRHGSRVHEGGNLRAGWRI